MNLTLWLTGYGIRNIARGDDPSGDVVCSSHGTNMATEGWYKLVDLEVSDELLIPRAEAVAQAVRTITKRIESIGAEATEMQTQLQAEINKMLSLEG